VAFVRQLLDHLKATLRVDEDRVYVTGISNGGIMAYELAMRMPEVLAAAAPVAGATHVGFNRMKAEKPCGSGGARAKISILDIHGKLDGTVPANASDTTSASHRAISWGDSAKYGNWSWEDTALLLDTFVRHNNACCGGNDASDGGVVMPTRTVHWETPWDGMDGLWCGRETLDVRDPATAAAACTDAADPASKAQEIVRCIWNGGHEWGPRCSYDANHVYVCDPGQGAWGSALVWSFLARHKRGGR